jgi:glycosyltransferase involved in cell wall biosynthesis
MISIIVPVYNSEKTLERCMESLINQTYSDIEILLVIDGPTDSSLDIGRTYEKKDSRVKVILKENEGVSKARNTGLTLAKGEYIQFVDSDDYISPKMCEKLIKNVENTGAQMVLCGFHHIFLNRDILKVPNNGIFSLKQNTEEFLRLYETGFLNMPWNKLFKREWISEGFDSSLSLGEDLLFNLDYMKKIDQISVIEEPLYYYIQQNGQDTLSTKKRKDKYQIAVRICEAVKEFYFSLLKDCDAEEHNTKIEAGSQVIHKRLILEFLDEIEGMAYDKALNRKQKLETIDKYMKDAYIRKANQRIGSLQIDYSLINFFFKRKNKYMVYLLIYLRKWCLHILRGF